MLGSVVYNPKKIIPLIIIGSNPLRNHLVGGFNPFEKYARQIGSSPQVGVNIKRYLSCHHRPSHLLKNIWDDILFSYPRFSNSSPFFTMSPWEQGRRPSRWPSWPWPRRWARNARIDATPNDFPVSPWWSWRHRRWCCWAAGHWRTLQQKCGGWFLQPNLSRFFWFGMVKDATPTFSSSGGRCSWNMFTVDFFGTRWYQYFCRSKKIFRAMPNIHGVLHVVYLFKCQDSRQIVVLNKFACKYTPPFRFVDATSLHINTTCCQVHQPKPQAKKCIFFALTWNQPKSYADVWSIFPTFHQFLSWSHQPIRGTSRSWLPPLHATGRCAAPPCNNAGLARHAAGCREYEAKRRPRGRILLRRMGSHWMVQWLITLVCKVPFLDSKMAELHGGNKWGWS